MKPIMKPIIGRHTYIGDSLVVKCMLGPLEIQQYGIRCEIGNFCSIADNVTLFVACDHDTSILTTFPFDVIWGHPFTEGNKIKSKGSIIIGHDVWIASHATIMSGVTIGDGAVIGTRAIVTKDVPPYGIAVGNPARTVKKRFTEQQIEQLVKIRWGDWSDPKIRKNLQYIMSRDIDKFIDMFKDKV